MADVNVALDANRAAINELIAAAERCREAWTQAPAPGKWSPCQVVEHVALSLEESANVVSEAPSKFPTLPRFVRPLVRSLFFDRVLRKGGFPKAKTGKAFNPASGPATPADSRARLEAALARFDQACRSRAGIGHNFESTLFGTISVADYARFIELRTRHHHKQIARTLLRELG